MNLFRNPSHLIILVAVLVVVFGAARLPMLAKNVGQSLKIFRKEVREMSLDAAPEETDKTEAVEQPK